MLLACNQPNGYVSDSTDCDDTDGAVYPGAVEVYDGINNDCNGFIDEDPDCDADLLKVCAKVTMYPVPFTNRLNVKYHSESDTNVHIDVFDAKGVLIHTVIDRDYRSGSMGMKVIDCYRKAN
jgi:hypothetical protein